MLSCCRATHWLVSRGGGGGWGFRPGGASGGGAGGAAAARARGRGAAQERGGREKGNQDEVISLEQT